MRTGISTARVTRIRKHGIRYSGKCINVRFLPHRYEFRYAAVISKRQGGAVERNRIRRSIRGIMQTKAESYPTGWYLIYYNESCTAYDRRTAEADLDRVAGSISLEPLSTIPSRTSGRRQTEIS